MFFVLHWQGALYHYYYYYYYFSGVQGLCWHEISYTVHGWAHKQSESTLCGVPRINTVWGNQSQHCVGYPTQWLVCSGDYVILVFICLFLVGSGKWLQKTLYKLTQHVFFLSWMTIFSFHVPHGTVSFVCVCSRGINHATVFFVLCDKKNERDAYSGLLCFRLFFLLSTENKKKLYYFIIGH